MESLKKIIIFVILPILAITILYINGNIQAAKYQNKLTNIAQYDANISTNRTFIKVKAGKIFEIPLKIKNTGSMSWVKDDKNSINLSYHVLNEKNQVILHDGERTNLVNSVRSGETTELNAKVKAPDKAGIYYIEFDMVHEGVAWFKEKGSKTLKIKIEVEQ